ncbi:P-loop NTPase fold protein [Sphingobium sp. KCTC 72723]|uniref:KAP family P-loop NTPase fold protein n=1 Tax=Sphingobium sp. KCTC 72723 TaxID=2733867 RepID=UPI00165E3E23|nr:P-loop NTPase fold protein [Sphingobium sp. KCTC 72723]
MTADEYEQACIAIWHDDMLDRREEANLICSYVEGFADVALIRVDQGALTLAIDGGYGQGKTFFLKHLAEQLRITHPVAYIDAWSDDIADDPLTALVATLTEALAPYFRQSAELEKSWRGILDKSGKVAKIAGVGVFKRLLGLAITGGSVEALSDVLTNVDEDVGDAIKNSLEELGKDAVESTEQTLKQVAPDKLMADRVTSYREGRKAIADLKTCLEAMVENVTEAGSSPPVVIVIDELDRCRPTYAIKLLEEIKHLFDVAGLVFIFGMHGQQLAHSVNAAYGANFDGPSYLKRFIKRRYTLKDAEHVAYVQSLLQQTAITEDDFSFYQMAVYASNPYKPTLAQLVSEYLYMYDLSARDAIELIDILATCASLSKNKNLVAPLLIPLAIGTMKGLPKGSLPTAVRVARWEFRVFHRRSSSIDCRLEVAAGQLKAASEMTYELLCQIDDRNAFQSAAIQGYGPNGNPSLDGMQRYPDLVSMVSRIQRPALEE